MGKLFNLIFNLIKTTKKSVIFSLVFYSVIYLSLEKLDIRFFGQKDFEVTIQSKVDVKRKILGHRSWEGLSYDIANVGVMPVDFLIKVYAENISAFSLNKDVYRIYSNTIDESEVVISRTKEAFNYLEIRVDGLPSGLGVAFNFNRGDKYNWEKFKIDSMFLNSNKIKKRYNESPFRVLTERFLLLIVFSFFLFLFVLM